MKKSVKRMIGGICALSMLTGTLSACEKSSADPDMPEEPVVDVSTELQETEPQKDFPETYEIPVGSYAYDPEEIMFLSGVTACGMQKDMFFSMKDLDGDMISELFVMKKSGDGDDIAVYSYDSTQNKAVLTKDAVYDKNELVWAGGDQWIDATVLGAAGILGDPGVKEDFYLSVNYDFLADTHINTQGDEFNELDMKNMIDDQKLAMINERDKYQGKDIQILRDYLDVANDWDRRNADGIEPVKKYLEDAANINSISELDKFLADTGRNPFCRFFNPVITLDEEDTSEWILELDEDATFSVLPRIFHNSDTEDIKEIRADYEIAATHILTRAGLTEEEVAKMIEESYVLEDALLEAAWPNEESDNPVGAIPVDEVCASCSNFPLKAVLNGLGVNKGKLNIIYPDYLPVLDEMYTEENLSIFRSYIMTHIAYMSYEYLDLEAGKCLMSADETDEEYKEYVKDRTYTEIMGSRGILGVAEENAYMTYYVDPKAKETLTMICEDTAEAFAAMIKEEEWLSEEGKAAALEKLNKMKFCVLSPDELIDSSYLAIDTSDSFYDTYVKLRVSNLKHNCAATGEKRVPGEWRYDLRPEIATSVDNAYYNGSLNQFFVLAGFISDFTFSDDMPYEEMLAKMGSIIGHELTHGFDPNGIQYDADGNKVATDDKPYGWMPEADYNAYMEKAKKVSAYFDKVVGVPYMACSGEQQWGEASADIAGVSIAMKIAQDHPGFDYDCYFRSRAELWREQMSLIRESGYITDAHPFNYLRVNAVNAQFDEFVQTYGLSEDNRMYIPPEERITIW